jgi:hypothetical protein
LSFCRRRATIIVQMSRIIRINQSVSARNEELQNKPPAVSRHAEPVRKKLLFCKTNYQRPVIEPSPCGKNYFLQNKPSAASRHAEPMRDAGWCAGVRPAAQLR